jgi:hypothetical protein
MLPEVPAVLPLWVGVLVPGCDPAGVEPDWAARLTANAQAMATPDAVVTTRFMS